MSLITSVRGLLGHVISDTLFLRVQYWMRKKTWLDLRSPKTITAKLQWLKLYYRRSDLKQLVNKYECRAFVTERIGSSHLPELLASYDHPDEIDWEQLPDRFVIKVSHGCGMNILCRDKTQFDRAEAIVKLTQWQSVESPAYTKFREWAYRGGSRKIIVEEFLENEDGNPPDDYKVFCFNGKPKFVQVDFDRFDEHRRGFYDLDWTQLPFAWRIKTKEVDSPPPRGLEKMIEIAEVLSKDLPFARIDLYEIGDRVLLGEITLYPGAGYGHYVPAHYDEVVGDMLTLPDPIKS